MVTIRFKSINENDENILTSQEEEAIYKSFTKTNIMNDKDNDDEK